MRHIKLLPAVAAAALAISGLAGASTVRELPSVVVKFGDLNLQNPAGVARLHARLHAAAQLVCSQLDSRVLGLREQYENCVADAVTASVAKVGNANLSAFHRYGRRGVAIASNR
ncbi:MAG TPA: UrcA family protein [Steroidobacteraceae bacterium]|nr:UrcA family protein [Steroidobacteraceae bacterium]